MIWKLLLAVVVAFVAIVSIPSVAAAHQDPLWCAKAPTRIEIDITTQSLYVYADGELIRAVIKKISTADTSKPRYHKVRAREIIPYQPTGCFTIQGKQVRYFSKAYEVWIRYPVWLRGPGIPNGTYAIHCVPAGKARRLGRPDSGGCVRTPNSFCKWFYGWARKETPVLIYGQWNGGT